MHWADVVAEALIKRGKRHVIASGTSISGQPHLGSAGDVIYAEVIARAVRDAGGEAEVIWIRDDMDPLRSVPEQLPAGFEAHLGKPVCDLPGIEGKGYVEHFSRPFLRALAELGVRPRVVSGAEMYRGGAAEGIVREALGKAPEVRRILEEVSGTTHAEDWLPFQPVCAHCGRIATTHAYGQDPEGRVLYRCTGGIAGNKEIAGCGYEGAATLRDGKLSWRLDWSGRWKILGVTCEPFGKDHAAAGGSWDTATLLTERIFNYPAPVPVIYEHIFVGGEKMSKSRGNVVTMEEFLAVAPPEAVRYFFVRTDPRKHKEFEWTRVPPIIEDYEQAERIYFGIEKAFSEKEEPDIKRAYELSQVEQVPGSYFQVPYRHLLVVVQTAGDWEGVRQVLARSGHLRGISREHEANLAVKAASAHRWVARHAPDHMRFELAAKPPDIHLTPEELRALRALEPLLEKVSWDASALHDLVYAASESASLPPKTTFRALYRIFLGKDRGPRMGYFLEALEREFVMGRIGFYAGREKD
ncbi:MAG: lysine--tRNA ligase [Candidatus Thermoplasmatota archaeon]